MYCMCQPPYGIFKILTIFPCRFTFPLLDFTQLRKTLLFQLRQFEFCYEPCWYLVKCEHLTLHGWHAWFNGIHVPLESMTSQGSLELDQLICVWIPSGSPNFFTQELVLFNDFVSLTPKLWVSNNRASHMAGHC
jgi:hypothetical protein